MTHTQINPRVYVGTYAKYNDGNLAGEWVNLSDFSSYDDFYEHCKEIHKDEEDPEIMFQDYEGFPNNYYNESSIDAELWDYINLIEGGADEQALNEYIEAGYEMDDFEEAYQGQHTSEESFAEQLVDDIGMLESMPENLRYYFDYEKFARDLFLTDYWMSNSGHVFRNL